MIWNATMPVWVCIVFIIAFALVTLYMAFVARRHALASEYTAASKQGTIDENTQLREDLQEAQATITDRNSEIERLRKPGIATLPLQEAVKPEPMAYSDAKPAIEKAAQSAPSNRPQRGRPKKAGAQ